MQQRNIRPIESRRDAAFDADARPTEQLPRAPRLLCATLDRGVGFPYMHPLLLRRASDAPRRQRRRPREEAHFSEGARSSPNGPLNRPFNSRAEMGEIRLSRREISAHRWTSATCKATVGHVRRDPLIHLISGAISFPSVTNLFQENNNGLEKCSCHPAQW